MINCIPEPVCCCCADGSSAWTAANQASMHLTPTQIAQLMPGYVQAPSKDGKSAFALGCSLFPFFHNTPEDLRLQYMLHGYRDNP